MCDLGHGRCLNFRVRYNKNLWLASFCSFAFTGILSGTALHQDETSRKSANRYSFVTIIFSISLLDFLSYGPEEGDRDVTLSDGDIHGPIQLSSTIVFYDEILTSLYVRLKYSVTARYLLWYL